jgi:DNA primase
VAGRIRQEDVDAVRQRSDIVKVVGEHLQLKKAGADSMVGICPFHPEKTPSFSISPSKQVYYCFGCGEGGDLFRFLQKVENLSFTEAVERLASGAGISLRYEGETKGDRQRAGRRQTLHRAVADAGALYQRLLLDGREATEARAYLAQRGISMQSVERFGVGYAPTYHDFLLRRLTRSYSAELLVEAGLASKDADGNLRDRFRGRVMFPIHDLSGNAVGFGGRLLAGPRAPQQAAKYVNSPESVLYHKGTLLYNLNRAKADVTRTGRAFLVEGYTDVIAMDQAGLPEAVATCGTALGEDHIRALARFATRIVLAFDSDDAGARAAERAFQFHERYPVEIAVLVLPEGQDPADFVLAHGEGAGEAFAAVLDRAVPLVEYMIDRQLMGRDLASAEGQSRAVKDVIESVLNRVEDQVLRERYAALTADRIGRTGLSERAVLRELEMAMSGVEAPQIREPTRGSPAQKVEREALKLLVQAPELSTPRLPELTPEHFTTPTYQKAFELIRDAAVVQAGAASLMAGAQDRGEQVQKLVAALSVEPPESEGPPTAEYAAQIFLRLEEFSLSRRIDGVRRQLERLNPLKAEDDYDSLFERLVDLEGARRRVRVAAESREVVADSDLPAAQMPHSG